MDFSYIWGEMCTKMHNYSHVLSAVYRLMFQIHPLTKNSTKLPKKTFQPQNVQTMFNASETVPDNKPDHVCWCITSSTKQIQSNTTMKAIQSAEKKIISEIRK